MDSNPLVMRIFVFLLCLIGSTSLLGGEKTTERLNSEFNRTGQVEHIRAIVVLADQVDLSALNLILSHQRTMSTERARLVVETLKSHGKQSQQQVVSALQEFPSTELLELEQLWISNMLRVSATKFLLQEIAEWPEVGYVDLDAPLAGLNHGVVAPATVPLGPAEPGLTAINAPLMWQAGFTGEGTIIMNIDTGVDGTHPALFARWRGTHKPAAETWFDPAGGTSFPEDCFGHGTATMGISTGLESTSADTIGVAFGAEWIAARTLCNVPHTSNTIQALQWALDPDNNPQTTDDMPDVITNSWWDPELLLLDECDSGQNPYLLAVEAVEAAGIAVIFSAEAFGVGPQSIAPPGNINTSTVSFFTVGALDANQPGYPIAAFSGQGPVSDDCETGDPALDTKPEVAAPGVSIRSSYQNGGYSLLSGTGMATPHVAGAIALLKQAHPGKTGSELKEALYQTASDLGESGEDNLYGAGLIDVWAAHQNLSEKSVSVEILIDSSYFPIPSSGDTIPYKIVVSNQLSSSTSTTIWLDLVTPGGNIISQIHPRQLNLAAGESKMKQPELELSASRPEGTYAIIANWISDGDTCDTAYSFEKLALIVGDGPESEWHTNSVNHFAQSYPNPFNPSTTIRIRLANDAPVSLKVYDTSGRVVKHLLDDKPMAPGEHQIVWNGTNQSGNAAASGTYIYRLVVGDRIESGKLLLVR